MGSTGGAGEPEIAITTRTGKTVEILSGRLGGRSLSPRRHDRPECHVDTQLITLLPGERHTFVVSTNDPDRFDHDAIERALFSASVARF